MIFGKRSRVDIATALSLAAASACYDLTPVPAADSAATSDDSACNGNSDPALADACVLPLDAPADGGPQEGSSE